MTKPVLLAFTWATLCSVVWISMAFMVAFPQETINLHASELARSFFTTAGIERLFIPLLVLVDISIDLVLGHKRMTDKEYLILLFVVIFYIIAAGVVPIYSTSFDGSWQRGVFWFILVLLFIPRLISYVKTRPFEAV